MDETYAPTAAQLQDALERRMVSQTLDLAEELDRMMFGSLDECGLLPVAVALSQWRDQLG